MVVLDILLNYQAQVAFPRYDDTVETLLFDGPHEPVLSEESAAL